MKYEDFYLRWKEWDLSEFGSFSDDDTALFRRAFSELAGNNAASKMQILDFGYGDGKFLGWCQENIEADLYGVEKSPALLELASNHGTTCKLPVI
jgi:trans-aconitate methyltransferase